MAWFTFTDASRGVFVLRLDDAALAAQARALLAGGEGPAHVGGTILRAPAEWNIGWSYRIDPATAFFFDLSAEVGDATMAYVEAHLDEAGGAFLPGRVWTPWSSRLTGELSPRFGTAGSEVLLGGIAADLILGRGGHDRLEGRGGADHLSGGEGWDQLFGGAGADRMDGGAGCDLLSGGIDADLLLGGTAGDRLEGGAGSDRLEGGAGADEIVGGAGNDRLDGGDGADLFVMRPGAGHDRIVFGDEAGDEDRLDLRGYGLTDLSLAIDVATGHVTIDLAGGDKVTLLGYAKAHDVTELGGADLLL